MRLGGAKPEGKPSDLTRAWYTFGGPLPPKVLVRRRRRRGMKIKQARAPASYELLSI
jgi:hypothetical protein